MLKKSKKRKAAGEGPSQRTPKAAKKKGNPSSVSVIESITVSTSEAMPSQPENSSPQTFEDFDIDFDPSVTLGNFLNEPHSPTQNPNPEHHQPELAKVLSDIELFDQDFSSPIPENPNTQQPPEIPQPEIPQSPQKEIPHPENTQPHSPQPEDLNPNSP